MQDGEAIHGLCYLLTASGNLFLKYEQLQWHHSYFAKDFQTLLAVIEGKIEPQNRALGQI